MEALNSQEAMKTVNSLIKEKYGYEILNDDGKVNLKEIKKTLPLLKRLPIIGTHIPQIVEDVQIEEKESGEGTEPEFAFDKDTLIMYVPKDLKEEIAFSIEYILSEFDKIQSAVVDLNYQFWSDRAAKITAAENYLKSGEREATSVRMLSLINYRTDLNAATEELKSQISKRVNDICNIPKDPKVRLFKIKTDTALAWEDEARKSVELYIRGLAINTEICLRLGEKKMAAACLNGAESFFESFAIEQFDRMEGWNHNKDLFWEEKIPEYIGFIGKLKTQIEDFNDNILIKVEDKHELRMGRC
ncbi:MAG: hypothetical protein LIO86_12625 [Lachnospiraceae bacterium]|nr:hypothetical protein [Lachnospiraceae bacterium]